MRCSRRRRVTDVDASVAAPPRFQCVPRSTSACRSAGGHARALAARARPSASGDRRHDPLASGRRDVEGPERGPRSAPARRLLSSGTGSVAWVGVARKRMLCERGPSPSVDHARRGDDRNRSHTDAVIRMDDWDAMESGRAHGSGRRCLRRSSRSARRSGQRPIAPATTPRRCPSRARSVPRSPSRRRRSRRSTRPGRAG
jgi:hypothetical protein